MTALLLAARKGHVDVVQVLLNNGANVDDKDYVSVVARSWLLVDLLRKYKLLLLLLLFSMGTLP